MDGPYPSRYRKQDNEEAPAQSNGAGSSRLDAQLRAYHAKALRAQTRLSEALDVIDEMERKHAEQLAQNERREAKLKQKMRAYADIAKKAEEETEDMRNAVLKLIDKVEKGNGYRSVKPSQLHTTSLLDPIPPPEPLRSTSGDSDELLSYAATMLEVARRERNLERKAHQKTKEWAHSRIAALEAQLSRREAELARCATHCLPPERSPTTQQQPPPSYPQHEAEGMPYQQYIDTLQWTVSKNQTLEREIQALSEKLADVRMQDRNGTTAEARIASPSRKPKVVDELREQVQQLGKLVDALKEDKKKWRTVLNAEKSEHPSESLSRRLSAVEAECARLRRSEQELRRRLERSERQDKVGENVLKQRIELLESQLAAVASAVQDPPSPPIDDSDTVRVTKRQRLYKSPDPPPPPQPFPDFSPPCAIPTQVPDLLEEDGEVSMDLATPLIPTILIDEQEPTDRLLDSPEPRPQSPLEAPSPFELSPNPGGNSALPGVS
ncbi:hypothetical protein NMY22_g7019 [Coprinellus aureogranulatus]|nr:hypothetical protein NMY22_g7019 [Coprinellus aureogranulatus]